MTADDLDYKLHRIANLVTALSILVYDLNNIPLEDGSSGDRTRQALIGVTHALEEETK